MQATKLLQLKKVDTSGARDVLDRLLTYLVTPVQATAADIDILFDVCWILSPTQIQKLISQYHVAEYEVCTRVSRPHITAAYTKLDSFQTPIAPEILKIVSGRINSNDKGDHLLLPPESEEAMP